MLPKPKQLDLFGQVPLTDEQGLLHPGSPEENKAVEIHSRSPTEEDDKQRVFLTIKERADKLRQMSRALSSKSNQPGINQD